MSRPWLVFGCSLVLVLSVWVFASAEGDQAGGKLASLEARLAVLRQQQTQARQDVDVVNKEYFKFQHDVVYTNAVAAKLYQEVKSLERELREKRDRLNAMTWKLPEMRALTKRREQAFAKVRTLREQEQLVLNEIRALKTKAVAGPEKMR